MSETFDHDLRVVILVPRRAGKPDRDRVWAWVDEWWRTNLGYEIVEGHHDVGLFNRSAAVNRAARLADWEHVQPWDVAVIIDADVICDPDHVRQAIARAHETGRLTMPFTVRKDIDRPGSDAVMGGFRGNWSRYVHKSYTDMCSACIVVPRRLWDAVGGFDESFVGWGFEDNAFAAACETFAGAPIDKLPGELWHLWHETAREGKRGTATHTRNGRRAGLYLEAKGNPDAIRAIRDLATPSFEHRPTGIPPVLHRVVPEHTSAEVERWWDRFADLHPDWELRTWRDPLDPAEWPDTAHKWEACSTGAQLADLVRLEALLRFGGIYVDSDVEPWRAFDELLPLSAFAAWEDHRTVPNAVMGAVPGHPAIRECLDLALSRIPGDVWPAGPGVTTEVLVGRRDVILLPPSAFYPVHYRDPERDAKMADPMTRKLNPWAFGLHHYAGSWLKDGAKPPAVRTGKMVAVE
jgi:hypothetical protein